MKFAVFLFILLLTAKAYPAEPEIQQVKRLFEASAHSKVSADRLSALLSKVGFSDSPLLICYKGAAEMMQARYGFNPINKFRRFKKGKLLIEDAVKKEPDNIEIRFLRFAIQTNLPTLLNYNNHIDEDKNYLLSNLKTTTDKKLKQNILNFLSASTHCSEEEKKQLAT